MNIKKFGIAAILFCAMLGSAIGSPQTSFDFKKDAASAAQTNVVYGSGSIEIVVGVVTGNAVAVRDLLNLHPDTKTLVLDASNGGNFEEALKIASLVRSHGLSTVAKGACDSACAYIWIVGHTHSYRGQVPTIHLPINYPSFTPVSSDLYAFLKRNGLPKAFGDYVVKNAHGKSNDGVPLTNAALSSFGI